MRARARVCVRETETRCVASSNTAFCFHSASQVFLVVLLCRYGSQSWCSTIQILQATTESHPNVHRVGFSLPSAFGGLHSLTLASRSSSLHDHCFLICRSGGGGEDDAERPTEHMPATKELGAGREALSHLQGSGLHGRAPLESSLRCTPREGAWRRTGPGGGAQGSSSSLTFLRSVLPFLLFSE